MIKYKVEQLEENTKIKCDCRPPTQAVLKVTFQDGKEIYLCRKAFKKFIEEKLENELRT